MYWWEARAHYWRGFDQANSIDKQTDSIGSLIWSDDLNNFELHLGPCFGKDVVFNIAHASAKSDPAWSTAI